MPDMSNSLKKNSGKKLLALDLDETLVHSSFQVYHIFINLYLIHTDILFNMYTYETQLLLLLACRKSKLYNFCYY